MAKGDLKEIELKVRIPPDLMDEVRTFQHKYKIDRRKEAVVKLLRQGLDADDEEITEVPPSVKE